jgi:transposase InsO family protein
VISAVFGARSKASHAGFGVPRLCINLITMGIEDIITAPRSPWQNPYVERLIGSIRRECLDHSVLQRRSERSFRMN